MNTNIPPDYDDGSQNPLQKFTHNLTTEAKNGKLDPVIGRNEEIRRVMQVLSRRTKNNPVLIGDPGVGKTAIVEGLAQRIVSKDVPETLQNKELLVLDIALVLAGAKYRGEFEDRLKNIIKTVEKDPDKYILFIDELHSLVGAGGEGAMDAANILKPALARGQVRTIGATTIKEYRKYIEKDQALERRFQPVYVGEPSPEDSIAILRGIKEKYELHHGIRITDDAIISAVELSRRYITDRFLPDKAVDLIDEATSALKIETQSMPIELDTIKRKTVQLEIEQAALNKEKTDTATTRLSAIGVELNELKEKSSEKERKWQEQKKLIANIQKTRK
jgi:ATP-dependent Clp protease ATP-binding subunit ClpB